MKLCKVSLVSVVFLILIIYQRCNAAPTGFYSYVKLVNPSPIIFVPGKGGNQLEAIVKSPSNGCPTYLSWYRMWMDIWSLFKGGVGCWAENMHLYFNSTTKQSRNADGVHVRVPGWGTTYQMEYIDPSWTAWVLGNFGIYIANLVRALLHNGYVRDKNLRGAPYDFRYAPHSQPDYFTRFTKLVEETYEINGNRKVLLVSHSMGGLFASYFLNNSTTEWKDRYVAGLVTINTPWAGSVVVSGMYTAGYNWEIDAIDRLKIRGQQRSYETGIFLLPKPPAWKPDDVIIQTRIQNFTVENYDEFFAAINYTEGSNIMDRIREADYDLRHPGVPLYCFHTTGIDTPKVFIYNHEADFPDQKPYKITEDGDGTVNIRSLRACRQWLDNLTYPTTVKEFKNIKHNDILSNEDFISSLLEVAYRNH